ncbi:MAG: stage II sporulation protein M [Myxococcales bacterium]|nr:stage II sporulation protein M [Myxococcales bacterium]
MTAAELIRTRRGEWLELEALLGRVSGRRRKAASADELARFASLFRNICADLARARAQGMPDDLVDYLNALAARCHNVFYVAPPRASGRIWAFFRRTLPLTLRRNMTYIVAGVLLFFGPHFALMYLGYTDHPVIYKIVPKSTLRMMEKMHGGGHTKGRREDKDMAMAGFYVVNNIGIAFRCFASGIFFGLGSIYMLLFNGILLGAIIGYVAHSPSGGNLLQFIVAHGPFELFAIALAGAAGIRLGLGFIIVGNRRRRDALRQAGAESVQIVVAAAILLFAAAMTEGFFSPSSLPVAVKIAYGSICAAFLIFYFGVLPFFVARAEARREQAAAERAATLTPAAATAVGAA